MRVSPQPCRSHKRLSLPLLSTTSGGFEHAPKKACCGGPGGAFHLSLSRESPGGVRCKSQHCPWNCLPSAFQRRISCRVAPQRQALDSKPLIPSTSRARPGHTSCTSAAPPLVFSFAVFLVLFYWSFVHLYYYLSVE